MAGFSLAHLTAIVLSPPELIRVAARTGYASVGLRLIAVTPDSPGYALMDDPSAMRATKAVRAERLFPGEGGLDLVSLVRAMPDDLPIAIEIPMVELARTMSPPERLRRAVACTNRLLDAATLSGVRA